MATMKIARRSTAYAATRDSAMAAFAAMESAVQGQFELAHIAVATRIVHVDAPVAVWLHYNRRSPRSECPSGTQFCNPDMTPTETGLRGWACRTRSQKCRHKLSL
jgi:hypothetical protein